MSSHERQRAQVSHGDRAEILQVLANCDALDAVQYDEARIDRLGGLTNRIFKVTPSPAPGSDGLGPDHLVPDRSVPGALVADRRAAADRVSVAPTAVVVRLPGKGTDAYVDRAAERHNSALASEAGIGCRVLESSGGAMVSAFLEGRVLSPEIVRTEPDVLARTAHLLRRVHVGRRVFLGRFDPLATIARHRAALADAPAGTDQLIDGMVDRLGALDPPPRLVPCHNDPWPENFIDTDTRLHLLDWEYSAMGDPAWDLADLAVEADLDADARAALLAAYLGTHAIPGGDADNGHDTHAGRSRLATAVDTHAKPDPDTDQPNGSVSRDPGLRARVDALAPVTDLLWGLWALVQAQDGNPAEDWATYANVRLDRAARSLP